MDRKIGSFADMLGRAGHLVWTSPLETSMTEAAVDEGVLPHLADLKPAHRSTITNHVLSDDEMDHYEHHDRSVDHEPLERYKKSSDDVNIPLRNGPKTGSSIAIGHHFEEFSHGGGGREWARTRADGVMRHIGEISRAVKAPVPKDIHVWRGIKPESEIHRVPPGGHVVDHGFTGTSLDWQQAHGFAGEHGYERGKTWSGRQHVTTGAPDHWDGVRMMARIHVPAGTLGHHLDINGDFNRYGGEEELLLHRGTQFQVDRHELTPTPRGKGLVHVVHMTVIGQHPHQLVNHFGKPLRESAELAHEIVTANGFKRLNVIASSRKDHYGSYQATGHRPNLARDLEASGFVGGPDSAGYGDTREFVHADGSRVKVSGLTTGDTEARVFRPLPGLFESTGLAHEVLTSIPGVTRLAGVGGTGNSLVAGYHTVGPAPEVHSELKAAGWVQDPRNSTQRDNNSYVYRHPDGSRVHVQHFGSRETRVLTYEPDPIKESVESELAHEVLTAHGLVRKAHLNRAHYEGPVESFRPLQRSLESAGWKTMSSDHDDHHAVHPAGHGIRLHRLYDEGTMSAEVTNPLPISEARVLTPFRLLKEDVQMKQVGEPLGTNDGGVHEDEHGVEHYVKHYADPDQGKTEALASKIYQHMGVKTVGTEHGTVNGKPATISRFEHRLEPVHHSEYARLEPRQAEQVGRMHHAALLMKDYDVVGTGFDNIMRHKDTGDLHTVDHGAAFRFRARGSPKAYDEHVDHDELRYNDRDSGHVFDTVFNHHPHAEQAGRDAVARMDMSHVHSLFRNSGLHDWEKLHSTFVSRRNQILSR